MAQKLYKVGLEVLPPEVGVEAHKHVYVVARDFPTAASTARPEASYDRFHITSIKLIGNVQVNETS